MLELDAPYFRAASAVGVEWPQALATCLSQLDPLPASCNVGFVFMSDGLAAEADRLLQGLRQATGIVRWVGAAASAIYRPGHHQPVGPGLTVMVGAVPEGAAKLIDAADLATANIPGTVALLHVTSGGNDVLIHLDRLASDSEMWPLGGTMHSLAVPVSVAGGLSEGGITGIAFTEALAVLPLIARAGVALGPPCRLDARRGTAAIVRLNGRRALDILFERCGDLLRHRPSLLANQISIGIPMAGSAIRTVARVVRIDEAEGVLELDRELPPTDEVYLLRRDGQAAQTGLRDVARATAAQLDHRPVRALIYYLPADRQRFLLGPAFDEIGLVREILGTPPTIGVTVDQTIVGNRLESLTSVALVII